MSIGSRITSKKKQRICTLCAVVYSEKNQMFTGPFVISSKKQKRVLTGAKGAMLCGNFLQIGSPGARTYWAVLLALTNRDVQTPFCK